MAVIAMTREMGSLGKDVALGLAEELGLDLVQHEIVEQVADKMHLGQSAVNRFLEGKAGLLERWGIDKSGISLYTTEEILDVAARGDVLIRGWGATYVLRPISHVVCVRVCAPLAFRARVLMDRIGISDEEMAIKEIKRNDAAHSRTMLHLFHVNWEDPLLYDIVLNTGKVSVEDCTKAIKGLVELQTFRETTESCTKLSDMKLEAKIRSALRGNPRTHETGPHFDVTVESQTGKVTLSGVAAVDDFKHEAESVVLSVPGVNEVDNQLTVMRRYVGT